MKPENEVQSIEYIISKIDRFEYKNEYTKTFLSETKLNNYGIKGWELINFSIDKFDSMLYIFKRKLQC